MSVSYIVFSDAPSVTELLADPQLKEISLHHVVITQADLEPRSTGQQPATATPAVSLPVPVPPQTQISDEGSYADGTAHRFPTFKFSPEKCTLLSACRARARKFIASNAPGYEVINGVLGFVRSVDPLRTFERNGKTNHVVSFLISDSSGNAIDGEGSLKIIAWSSKAWSISGFMEKGDIVYCSDIRLKGWKDSSGRLSVEGHLTDPSIVEYCYRTVRTTSADDAYRPDIQYFASQCNHRPSARVLEMQEAFTCILSTVCIHTHLLALLSWLSHLDHFVNIAMALRRSSARLAKLSTSLPCHVPIVKEAIDSLEDARVTLPEIDLMNVTQPDLTPKEGSLQEPSNAHKTAPKKRSKSKPKVEIDNVEGDAAPPKKRRKKNAEPLVFPTRYLSSEKLIGSHVSISGGAENAPVNASLVGGRAFALFLKNQRQWAGKPLSEDTLRLFPLRCEAKDTDMIFADGEGFDRHKHVVPHGCYLVNLANPDQEKWQKSYECFLDEVKRAESLGIHLFNFHPGSTTGACTREEGISNIAKGINQAHQATKQVIILLENMAGKGNVIGGTFQDLADVITLVDDKERVGICFDTCHAFAAGYDLRTPQAYQDTMNEFKSIVGLRYLKAIHCNDSKGAFQSHRDLHENIGMGGIGLLGFASFMADPRMNALPFILETPMLDGTLNAAGEGGKVWNNEISLLYEIERVVSQCKPDDWQTQIDTDLKIQELFNRIKQTVEANNKLKEAKKAEKKAKKAESGGKSKKQGIKNEEESALSDLSDDLEGDL